MKKRKSEYKELYTKVREIFNKYDLIGLIDLGFPSDEYDQEISKILPMIDKSSNVEELSIAIVNIFNKNFEIDIKSSDKIVCDLSAELFELKEY